MPKILLSELKNLVDFQADIPLMDIDCEIEGEIVHFSKGEHAFYEGDTEVYFTLILEGTLQVYKTIKGQEMHISTFTKGMTSGEVVLLSGNAHLGNARAITDLSLFRIDADCFWAMMSECPNIRKAVLANSATRSYEMKLAHKQRERLVSLGMLSAGLAHELNNPASAAKRSADSLAKNLKEFDIHSANILAPIIFKTLPKDEYPFQAMEDVRNLQGIEINPIEKSNREDELIDWLENLGVENAWDIAPTLVYVGYTKEILEKFTQKLKPEYVKDSLIWIQKETEMYLLVDEQLKSTQRIFDLVNAIKSYSYMDNSDGTNKVKTDIHKGLKETLLILNHKLKQKRIKVDLKLKEDLPEIEAFGGELNQVWTNLIDNAIDVVPEIGGEIEICTDLDKHNPDMITIQIKDNGAGIPPNVMEKIFDPFFTTKPTGKGTGIGLQIVERIICNQHKGLIRVSSIPGETIFRISLPLVIEYSEVNDNEAVASL